MSIAVVTMLLGGAMTLVSCAVFATLVFLAAFGRIQMRPVFLLLLLPMFGGLALLGASLITVVGNPLM